MSFSKEVGRFTVLTEQAADDIVRGITIGLFSAVIKTTPVLDGRLRGDWQTTVGSPAASENGRVDKSGSAAIAEVVANTPEKSGGETFMTNNMPYAYDIEFNGHSSVKAPQGMVRINMARINKLVAIEARKNRI